MHDPADEHVVVAQPARQIGGHVHADRAHEVALSIELDADQSPDRAATIAAEHVVSAHLVLLTGRAIADAGRHALAVLLQRHEFVVEAHAAGVQLFSAGAQERLEADLRQVGLAARARGHPGRVRVAAVPALHLLG